MSDLSDLNIDHHAPCARRGRGLVSGRGWLEHLGTSLETTESQLQIHDFLDTLAPPIGSRIFHAGIGCSTLAQRYIRAIYAGVSVRGCTVHPAERDHAQSLQLLTYRVNLADKHDPSYLVGLLTACSGQLDWVIDNNPASYACCTFHFLNTYRAYVALLVPGGSILHETPRGLNWVASGSAKIKLTLQDLERLAEHHGLDFKCPTGRVVALRRPSV